MKKINLIIEIHQPVRLETYRFFEVMSNHYYYTDYENQYIIEETSEKSYLPVNRILLDLILHYKGKFNISFLFSGVVLDQFKLYSPETLESFKTLVGTGNVGLLSGTYSNLFGPIKCSNEYYNQIELHKKKIKSVFGREPITFLPVDSFQNNWLLTYPGIRISAGNRKLVNAIISRISRKDQSEWLTNPERLVKFLNSLDENGNGRINLIIPYNCFGNSHNFNRQLIDFLEDFPHQVFSKSDYSFEIPSEKKHKERWDLFDSKPVVEAHKYRQFLSTCNELQIDAYEKLYSFCEQVNRCDDPLIKKDWLYLQTSDHFQYMNPSLYEASVFKGVFIPYETPFFAYINYMNVLTDFSQRLEYWISSSEKNHKYFEFNTKEINYNALSVISLGRT